MQEFGATKIELLSGNCWPKFVWRIVFIAFNAMDATNMDNKLLNLCRGNDSKALREFIGNLELTEVVIC